MLISVITGEVCVLGKWKCTCKQPFMVEKLVEEYRENSLRPMGALYNTGVASCPSDYRDNHLVNETFCVNFWVYLGVRTCEVFLCFITIIFLGSIVLTSLFSLFYVTCERNRFLH